MWCLLYVGSHYTLHSSSVEENFVRLIRWAAGGVILGFALLIFSMYLSSVDPFKKSITLPFFSVGVVCGVLYTSFFWPIIRYISLYNICIRASIIGIVIALILQVSRHFIFSTILSFEHSSTAHWYLEIALLWIGIGAFIVGFMRWCFVTSTAERALECFLAGFGAMTILLQGTSLLFAKVFS